MTIWFIQEKSQAIAYDTSLIVVTEANTKANTTAGLNEKAIAMLYPTNIGTLELSEIDFCHSSPTMIKVDLNNFYYDTTTIPMSFNLSRFLDNGQLVKFEWKTGAFVYGLLRGVS